MVGSIGAQAGVTRGAGAGSPAEHRATVMAAENIVLQRPNRQPAEAMALGNGSLGIAVWAADGMTVQLNRSDVMPGRLSPGQVVLPGLRRLTEATDYSASLDLYHGEFVERGGGMTARVYVEPATDSVVIAVSGARADEKESAALRLWEPRQPRAVVVARYGVLEESWTDNKEPGASGRRFGSLAAIAGEGRDVQVFVKDKRTVSLALRPNAQGDFTIRIAVPAFNGTEPGAPKLARMLAPQNGVAHRAWWQGFWEHTALIAASSPDGVAQYMANLRDLYLFYAAGERGTAWPGSQAGIADMFSAVKDAHRWDPAAFWHWNLRMMTAANLRAGVPELNESYFRLYRDNVASVKAWTRQHMDKRPGLCVPETMRFNGPGYEYELWDKPVTALNCAEDSPPYYNARTLSTGAEVSFWIWQQYLATDDEAFLRQNYSVMRESARFMLAYQRRGVDGMLHTSPSNAHETQWDVLDPITDVAGLHTLYTNTLAAATLLHEDVALAGQLRAALAKLPALPRTTVEGEQAFAPSAEPGAAQHNVENLGLEPVWPYGLVSCDGPDGNVARWTYRHRPYPLNQDWSFDPIQAARLGLGAEVGSTLTALTEHYQVYPNGFASWGGDSGEFYIEQSGVVADALSEALAQDYDGVLRLAPAVPPHWNMEGTVALQHRSRVNVAVHDGVVRAATLYTGLAGGWKVKDPWGEQAFTITDARTGRSVQQGTGVVVLAAEAGHSYRLLPARGLAAGVQASAKSSVSEAAEAGPRHLGSRTIGLAAQALNGR